MKKSGFTLAETTIAMIILGLIAATLLHTLKPNNMKREFMDKSAKNMVIQIEYATKQILARNTLNYSLLDIVAVDNTTFSIASSGQESKLAALYKKYLIGLRKSSIPASYTSSSLTDEAGTSSGYTISSFANGFKLKNGAYMAFKLNGNCTTSETKIYNPTLPQKRTETNSCGLVFYDINSEAPPNNLGVDQFILSIGKYGIK
ncbi:MAG: prepilin-type N-terminal cleavage/methylation domain-containing protein [Candidatus Gastranaerophilales bacterium]|nr:prepilin-type N-terminal cleavage/methylation domain-containing protein [Candidatus Gastranaerophilales bacterium]